MALSAGGALALNEPTVGECQDAIGDELLKKRETATGWDAKPVPIGGQHHDRIPESMKENAPLDWRLLPEAQVEILPEYGQEHDNLVQLRKDLEQVKRLIDSLGPICEAGLRCQMELQEKEMSEEKTTMKMMQAESSRKQRDNAFQAIQSIVSKIEDTDATTRETTKVRMEALAAQIVEKGSKDFQSKEEFHEYWNFCKLSNRNIFAENKKLLERIKLIKRDHKKAEEAAAAAANPAQEEAAAEAAATAEVAAATA